MSTRSPSGCEAVHGEPFGTSYHMWVYAGRACAPPPGHRNCESPASRCYQKARDHFYFHYDFRVAQSGDTSTIVESCRQSALAMSDSQISAEAVRFLIEQYDLDPDKIPKFRKAVTTGEFHPVPGHLYNCCVLDPNTGFCSMAPAREEPVCRCVSVMHYSNSSLFD